MASVRSDVRRPKKPARRQGNSKAAPAKVTRARSWEGLDRPATDLADLRLGLLYWLYERHDFVRAQLYADLIESLLREIPKGSITEAECRSLIAEARGDFSEAIRHRKREVARIRRLHEASRGTPQEATIFKLYGYGELSDRLDLLATLYYDAGKVDKAIVTLNESRTICETHRIPFDGAEMLSDFQSEVGLNGKRSR